MTLDNFTWLCLLIASIVWITISMVADYIAIASIITTLSNVTIIVAIFLRMKSALGRFFLSKLSRLTRFLSPESSWDNIHYVPTVPCFARLVSSFIFLCFFHVFLTCFKISASVDLQIMKNYEMVSAFCTYFQTSGVLTLVASRGQNLRLLSLQKVIFLDFGL